MPTGTGRGAHFSAAVNGKIYVFGGFNTVNYLSTVLEYDPATDTWTRRANMPAGARGSFGGGVVNGKIYIIAGFIQYQFDQLSGVTVSAVEEYDPATDTWMKKTDIPSPGRGVFGTSTVNNKIYVIGGAGGGSRLNIVDEYNPQTDTWVRKANMPTARNLLTASAVGGRIYAIGGNTNTSGDNGTAIVEEYDTGFGSSTVSVDPKGKLATTWATIKQSR